MSFLPSNIQWDKFDVIGFDMDGTLYDEVNFIEQVYQPISLYLANISSGNPDSIYNWLINRWKEKGSSYPYIFKEAIQNYGITVEEKMVKHCIEIYRNFKPTIFLDGRIILKLDQLFYKNCKLFLVSDGNPCLQESKFKSLKLSNWFDKDNIVFTGKLGQEFYKPNIAAVKYISFLNDNEKVENVLYVGDRELDRKFADNAGFEFLHVWNFNLFWDVQING